MKTENTIDMCHFFKIKIMRSAIEVTVERHYGKVDDQISQLVMHNHNHCITLLCSGRLLVTACTLFSHVLYPYMIQTNAGVEIAAIKYNLLYRMLIMPRSTTTNYLSLNRIHNKSCTAGVAQVFTPDIYRQLNCQKQ